MFSDCLIRRKWSRNFQWRQFFLTSRQSWLYQNHREMEKESSTMELRPDRFLLDPSFGGYKLSLDSIPIYRKTIDTGVKVLQPNDNQYSFYHVKMFSLQNHLYVNPHKPESAYFIDKNWKVFKLSSQFSQQQISLKEVFQIPNVEHQSSGNHYNASIVFPTSCLVVLSDGRNSLYLANVLEDGNGEQWNVLQTGSLLTEDSEFIITDARVELINNEKVLNVLLLTVEEKEENKRDVESGLFQTKLKWRTFIEEGNIWKKKCDRELHIDGSVDYVALESGCKSLYIISDKEPQWVYDSEKPIQPIPDVEMRSEPPPKLYTWAQTEEEVTIWLQLVKETVKSDLVISVDDLQVEVRSKGKTILSGKFFQRVSKDLTTWSYEKNQLVIQLTKHENGLMWKTLIPGDDRGEEKLDPEIVENIHNKLAHLCSDREETGGAVSFGNQQLEECDAVSCDTTSLFRINGENHSTTHKVSLSSLQWLFKVSCDADETPAICVRHDVDACVWQFSKSEDEKTWPHKHIGTFSAFGYVQASKTQKKFVVSPPNLSYVAVLEASHHIYIYRQPSPLTSELKNRFTGKKVETISKQQLVNLEAKDQILGVHATNNLLFMLLENSVCVLVINV